jgi:hypothetical protein
MKLIILGNGFDLHHKYKTSFYDFRTHLLKSKNPVDQILIKKIDQLLDVNKEKPKTHLHWNDFEAIVGKTMTTGSFKKDSIKQAQFLIEEFTQNFYDYLLNITKSETHQINETLAEDFKDVSTILTFNYTPFYSSYIKESVDVFHIHGQLTEDKLPIIGFYYPNIKENNSSPDYTVRYGGKVIHKPALAFKQNEIYLDSQIDEFIAKWKNKILEVTIIGYSFGSSDSHIYNILNQLLINQTNALNVPNSRANKIKSIKIKIYSYNEKESYALIEKIKAELTKAHRIFSINVTGVGFTLKEKEILTFELINY